ncbi:hypothetical protein OAX78_04550, partial [Planctomycetota bacterium]|nr:hypothetical protein [Planctomycetota bacterium]
VVEVVVVDERALAIVDLDRGASVSAPTSPQFASRPLHVVGASGTGILQRAVLDVDLEARAERPPR